MITRSKALRSFSIVILIAVSLVAGRTAWLWACGPFLADTATFGSSWPLHHEAYAKGELGVVQPTFARRYLVQAYRVLSGRPPLTESRIQASMSASGSAPRYGIDDWIETRERVLGRDARSSWEQRDVSRSISGLYSSFVNCQDDAFVTASRTLEGHIATFGLESREVREWAQAQTSVFANCAGKELVLPDAPSTTDPVLRADYEYQVAAAYFYGTDYAEAASRFRKIALNEASRWQEYGRYLAARANIRSAIIPDHPPWRRRELLTEAVTELTAVLADPRASAVHGSTRGLLEYVQLRLDPARSLLTLSQELGTAPTTDPQDLIDYRYLMDRLTSDSADFASGPAEIDQLVRANDLTHWIVAMQRGNNSRAQALQRWEETRSPVWLVPILWHPPADGSAAATMLEAAAAVPRNSPAFPTLAFLRARLMLARGERADARALLATLPREPDAGFSAETINLLRALRFQVADSLDELLANAPRAVIDSPDPDIPQQLFEVPPLVFDEDASELFTYRLPLPRLIEAARSALLPNRLRVYLASGALSRALVLHRDTEAREAGQLVRELIPATRVDIERYLKAASPEERHRAGLLVLLRTPALHAFVPGRHDSGSYDGRQTRNPPRDPRQFEHMFRHNWWCVEDGRVGHPYERAGGEIERVLNLKARSSYPAFLSTGERAAVEQELMELRALGPAQGYLAEEAIKWARARPRDLRAAEALALVVEGGRWSCSVPESSRRAFQTLHRLFPQSEWARRTKYWYAGI